MDWQTEQAVVIILFLTVFCGYVNYKFIKWPKSIGIMLVALLISSVIKILSIPYPIFNNYANSLLQGLHFNKAFLHGMLSFLLFAAAIHINPKELAQHKIIISCFTTISVLISTLLTGYAAYIITKLCGLNISFYYCMVFGALISPTDAIAVTELLANIKLPKTLELKISGEALFNDGIAIVLFYMALSFADGQETAFNVGSIILSFFREAGGGALFGLVCGVIIAKLLIDLKESDLMIILTLVWVTGGYIIASSFLNISGPISMVVSGLVIGQILKPSTIPNTAINQLENFWSLINEMLNAILFLIIGIEFVWIDISKPIIISAILLILMILAARWFSIYIPEFIFNFKQKNRNLVVSLITWCGLRGGISIALALGLNSKYHSSIVAITYFVVLFSIIVQGLTIRPLVSKFENSLS